MEDGGRNGEGRPPSLLEVSPSMVGKVFRPRGKANFVPNGNGIRNIRIRDNMDDILEARNLFRKHVADDANSIYRAVSDALYGTQYHYELLKSAYDLMGPDEKALHLGVFKDHPVARALAVHLNVRIDVVQYESDSLINKSLNKKKSARGKGQRRIELCFTPPHQYEPIYTMEHVNNCGFIQSVLYTMLYEDIFQLFDASEAAQFMLSDSPNKPEIYQKEFTGTALEALRNNLIPFPYKVAKTLCPDSYRNIEYDVWFRENRISKRVSSRGGNGSNGRRGSRDGGRHSGGGGGGRRECLPSTIGELPEGSPVLVRANGYEDVFGFFVRLTEDKKKAEVVVPGLDTPIYPQRGAVLPLKMPPSDISRYVRHVEDELGENDYCGSCPDNCQEMSPPECSPPCCNGNSDDSNTPPKPQNPAEVAEDVVYQPAAATASTASVQAQNVLAVMSNDPEWEAKVDFSVPPPLPPQMADCPVMPSTPPHSAGPTLIVPVPYSLLSPCLPAPLPLPIGTAHPPPGHPMPGTPLVRMPNSPFAFQFPSPMPSPMAVLPPHQVFTFPEYNE